MKVRYLKVLVDRGPMEKIATEIMAHEGPVLEAAHGGMDSLKLLKGERVVEVEDIDPADEYARLEAKYGIDPETKMSHVRMAYGALSEGRFERALTAGPPKRAKAPELPPEDEDEGDGEDAGDKNPKGAKGKK